MVTVLGTGGKPRGWDGQPTASDSAPDHNPGLTHDGLHATHRLIGCCPYPVPEHTAFPPDVPELWGEEQGAMS